VSFERAYEGLRVVDLSQGVAGPYCGMMLAQHGAKVIKVEPHEGDWARILGRNQGGHSAFSVPSNLGKRSIALDLKSDEGREIVERMLEGADIFIEGFRPGVIDRLGFSYDRLKKLNPELIYLSVSGFGQTGPLSKKPAMDPVLQAFVGAMDENRGHDGIPHRSPVVYFDMATALYSLQAVAAALYARREGHGGRRINISLMEAAANITTIRLQSYYRDGLFKNMAAPSGTFTTKDGWIQVVALKDHEYQKACKALGLTDLATDPRLQKSAGRSQHLDLINNRAIEVLKTKTSMEWRDILTKAGVQNEIMQNYCEFIEHPHTAATGLISWLPQAGWDTPWPVPNLPGIPQLEEGQPLAISPVKGQHSRELLAEFGYPSEGIEELFTSGIVLEPCHDEPSND